MADLLNNDLIHFEALKAQIEKAKKQLKKAKEHERKKIKNGYKWHQTQDKTWALKAPSLSVKKSR